MLTQIIVNTSGKARFVTQARNAKGQFGPATVSGLASYGITTGLEENPGVSVVVVQHSVHNGMQTVLSVNKETKKGRAFTFRNDGYAMNDGLRAIYNSCIK